MPPQELQPSLPESYRSVKVSGNWFRRLLMFLGPGYLVSVGYMDPGNWATDLAAGSQHGYALLWVVVLSSLMAMLLQTLCVRMGIGMSRDLAQACRENYPKPVSFALWAICEIAIVACDLAEVVGAAVAFNLLFGLPVLWGVIITGFDVLFLLLVTHFGFRKLELLVVALIGGIMASFAINLVHAEPDLAGIGRGLVTPALPGKDSLFLAIGILGATVMPHNLYLHTSLVQTRDVGTSDEDRRQAIRFGTIDVNLALFIAFFVNAAILALSASVFHKAGLTVTELQQAHKLLTPSLGGFAAMLFALALLFSGQSSTITGTLAGQVVMEGFVGWQIRPWIRRMITRSLAIVPAILILGANGGNGTENLLELSQVVLSMQLPFAIFPLVAFVGSRKLLGPLAAGRILVLVGYAVGAVITAANLWLLWTTPSIGPIGVLGGIAAILAFSAWVRWGYEPESEDADPIDRTKRRAASISLIFNIVSTALKAIVALITGSVSLLSEAMHSGADILSSAITLLGVKAAAAPPDEDHPYGHGKIESLSGFAEALLLAGTVVYVVVESVHRLVAHEKISDASPGIYAMALSAAGAYAIGNSVMKVARQTQSPALLGNGQHLLIDCATSVGVLLSLLITKLTGWTFVDPLTALCLAVWMSFSAARLGKLAYEQLIDRRLSDEEIAQVRAILKGEGAVLGFHRLRTRLSGSMRFVDVHIVVSRDLSVVESHAIADGLESQIGRALAPVEVVIHVDPFDPTTDEPQ